MVFPSIIFLRHYPKFCFLPSQIPLDSHRTANIFTALWKGMLLIYMHRAREPHFCLSCMDLVRSCGMVKLLCSGFLHGSGSCPFLPYYTPPSAWLVFLVMFLWCHMFALWWVSCYCVGPKSESKFWNYWRELNWKPNNKYNLSTIYCPGERKELDQLALILKQPE